MVSSVGESVININESMVKLEAIVSKVEQSVFLRIYEVEANRSVW